MKVMRVLKQQRVQHFRTRLLAKIKHRIVLAIKEVVDSKVMKTLDEQVLCTYTKNKYLYQIFVKWRYHNSQRT